MLKKILLTALTFQTLHFAVFSQTRTNEAVLTQSAKQHKEKEVQNLQKALSLAREKGWETSFKTRDGGIAFLVGVDAAGLPIYVATESNSNAAVTTGASQLWAGGSSGLNLNGSDARMADKMAVWDGGRVLSTHVELNNRVVQRDGVTAFSDHATHVAGTMVATGVNPLAKGMANGLPRLIAYDFSSDESEMLTEAGGLLVSNHSYGVLAGWRFNNNRWEWLGRPDETEDFKFGYYDNKAQMYDSIAYNSPYYLIVKSAGNFRDELGPAVGATYFRLNAAGQFVSDIRSSAMSSNNSYETMSTASNAKNILVVGAVNAIPNGYSRPDEVIMSSFSTWGPTDDGRIKPDIVANGVGVLSSTAGSDNSYSSYNGTSMAAPNAAGSLLLLQEYYARLNNGAFMRSATLKGLAIHTAEEAGTSPGPDYSFGWGLLNVAKAANLITSQNSGTHRITEDVLNNGATHTINVVASGAGPLVATIVWTDPKATVIPSNNPAALNNPEAKLVNDLDVRVTRGSTVWRPWVLTPFSPSAPATTGDNTVDNVEKIEINNAIPGETYTITITHKGTLQRGSQAYSLLVSGVGGTAYCTSIPTSTSGSRIDSVSFAGIAQANPAGCTSYSNFTNTVGNIQASQTLPLRVRVGSCDASSTAKIVKVFIDFNNNGSFNDAGENVATSGAITGSGVFTANVTTPAGLSVGSRTRMRVVVQETGDAGTVSACGSYSAGETQDYLLSVASASSDLTLDLVNPEVNACANEAQYVTVRIRNVGSISKNNIPVSVQIRNGATVVANLTTTFTGTVNAGASVLHTFQAPYNNAAGNTYNLRAYLGLADDQNRANDTLNKTVVVAAGTGPNAIATVCNGNASLNVVGPNNAAPYFWYGSAAGTTPLGMGSSLNTATVPANQTYYVQQGGRATVGPVSKMDYPDGGYNAFSGNAIRITSDVATVIENARLYIGHSGRIKFVVNPMATTPNSYYPSLGDSVILDVTATAPTPPTLGAQNNDPQDNGAIYNLGLRLDNTVSSNYILFIYCLDGASIYRSNNITTNPYPVGVPGLFSVTSSGATTNPQSFWYYFYDMKVRSMSCPTARTAVAASVINTPVITQSNDTLYSSAATGNQWSFNGNPIAGATASNYKPTQSGTYSVTVNGPGCSLTSTSFNFVLTSVTNVPASEISLKVMPNPNRGEFVLQFRVDRRDDLKIDLLNIQGQAVYSKAQAKFTGTYTDQLNLKELAAGVYVLRVQHGDKTYHQKIIVE